MTIIATNALLDLVTDDPRWFDWLAAQLGAAAALGPRVINDVIYAEVRFFSPARCFSAIERPEALGPAVMGLRLLSRGAKRYRTYFPKIDLVTP
jgi:hypothetical protein